MGKSLSAIKKGINQIELKSFGVEFSSIWFEENFENS